MAHDAIVEFPDAVNGVLVHDRPVLVQNDYMPRADSIKEMFGLTVISRVARKGELLAEHFERSGPVLRGLLAEMGEVLDQVWTRADSALLGIEGPKYRSDQLRLRPEARELTLERILGARGVG